MGCWGIRLFVIAAFTTTSFLDAKNPEKAKTRDPRQLSVIVADFDGTIGHNVGYYTLRRVANPEVVGTFMTGISGLPEEVHVPVADFEGNVGPRIGQLIGNLDARGYFVPKPSLEPVELSNGERIIPGLYYLDPQSGYSNFRPPAAGEPGHLISDVKQKIRSKIPFLLDGWALLSAAMDPRFKDRLRAAILTLRGQEATETAEAIGLIQKSSGQGKNDWPEQAFVNLTHPDNYEFSGWKPNYLQHLYDELAERVIHDSATPHFLVMIENDRKQLKVIDEMFTHLANRGVFSNGVCPILVNLVEPEVFANPDGLNWDVSPLQQITKMSRVTVYWPGRRVERTDNLGRVFELTLGLSPAEATTTLNGYAQNKLMCSHALVLAGTKKVSGKGTKK